MGKFLKRIITNERWISKINHYKDQPNNGPIIYAFETPYDNEDVINAFVNRYEYDNETNFTWRFGYNNGHPCIFITFTAINRDILNKNTFVCLETNTRTNNKNVSINVYRQGAFSVLSNDLKGITWLPINEITLNKEYILYISKKGSDTHPFGPWKSAKGQNKHREIPDDWLIKLNIRPSIRIKEEQHDRHHVYKSLPEYEYVEYLLRDEL